MNVLDDHAAIAALRAGKIGIIATDTIYGLVCIAGNAQATERLYAVKGRHKKPGTVIAATVQQIIDLGVKARYVKAVEQYWPNPLSVEIPTDIPYLDQGVRHVAFRIPADENLRDMLLQTGPLLTTSANMPTQPPAQTIDEAYQYFGERVDFYKDSGARVGHVPSTVIRIVDDAIEIIRPGAVAIDEATGAIKGDDHDI